MKLRLSSSGCKTRPAKGEDLILRGLSQSTQAAYLRALTQLARYDRRSPERISEREVAAYLLHLYRANGRSHSTCNQAVAALRFFYSVTLRRRVASFVIPAARQPSKLPHILSREELVRLFSSRKPDSSGIALLLTVYATGLGVSEVVALRVCDIDSDRHVLRARQGKGARDRTTLLSPRLLAGLRQYRQHERPRRWLSGRQHGQPADEPGPVGWRPLRPLVAFAPAW